MPPGESEEQSPGIAAVIFPVGSGTPITPVEETRRDPSRRPSALHAPADILRTASLPCLPGQALAFSPFWIPHQTPPARKPGTIISLTGRIPSRPHSAALLVFFPRSAGTRLVAPALPGGMALGGHARPRAFSGSFCA